MNLMQLYDRVSKIDLVLLQHQIFRNDSNSWAFFSFSRIIMEAPSLIPQALPAVTVPSSMMGDNFACPSIVVSERKCPSASNIAVPCQRPLLLPCIVYDSRSRCHPDILQLFMRLDPEVHDVQRRSRWSDLLCLRQPSPLG